VKLLLPPTTHGRLRTKHVCDFDVSRVDENGAETDGTKEVFGSLGHLRFTISVEII
jgi:hypothetical protein